MNGTDPNVIPNSPPADIATGTNGVSSPARVTGTDLENALSRLGQPAVPENDPTTSATAADPETPVAPAASEPGQDNLHPAESPEGESPEGEPENVLSQTDNAELESALAGLTPDVRKHLLSLAAEKPGEIPRIGKLIAERHQFVETIGELQGRIEQLEQGAQESGPALAQANGLPPNVARLKTVGEVKARISQVRAIAKNAQKLLMEKPNGDVEKQLASDPDKWTVGGQQLTREQLIEAWQEATSEAEVLPEREAQIQSQSRLAEVQAQAREQAFADFPWLKDPEHPETKAIAATLKQVPGLKQTPIPEYWAAVYNRGVKSMQEELATRKSGKANGAVPVTVRPAGKVPLGKPHSVANGASAGRAPQGLQAFRNSLPKPGAKVKGADLERALAALPGV